MTLLTLIQDATDLLGLARPNAVINASDQSVRELLALANEEGRSLSSDCDWQALTKEFTFLTTAADIQVGAIPSDFDHWISNASFNRTTRRELLGPLTPQQWQAIQAQPALSRVFLAFRERGGQLLITPTPTGGQTIAGEYVSKNWVLANDGVTYRSRFAADTDTVLIDEWLMVLGLRWRFKKSKGLEYGEDFDTYNRQNAQTIARDGGSTEISIGGRDTGFDIRNNVSEGNFPGT